MWYKKLEVNDKKFILDVISGEIFEVDDETFNKITEKTKKSENAFSNATLHSFKDVSHHAKLKTMELMVSTKCNLACSYCYAKQGSYGIGEKLMSVDVAKQSILFGLKHSEKVLNISFFGGEPLLNFGVIEESSRYALKIAEKTGKAVKFSITTNGTILSEKIVNFFKEYNFRITLTIDGFKEIHDRYRKFRDGSGSYEIVWTNLKRMQKSGCKVIPQIIISYENLHELPRIVRFFQEQGFDYLSIGEVFDPSPKNIRRYWTEEEINAFAREYFKVVKGIIENVKVRKKRILIHQLFKMLHGIDTRQRCFYNCDAAIGKFIAITPDGDIYPCQMLIGIEKFKIGNVMEQSYTPFYAEHVDKTSCKDCWLKYYCGGGCFALAYLVNGDMKLREIEDICERTKELFKIAVYLYSSLSDEEFNFLINGEWKGE